MRRTKPWYPNESTAQALAAPDEPILTVEDIQSLFREPAFVLEFRRAFMIAMDEPHFKNSVARVLMAEMREIKNECG